MTDGARIATGLRALATVAENAAQHADVLAPIVVAMRTCLANGGTLFFAGNGGSAADAQHIAAEYVVRYRAVPQRALRAIALTTDSSILTAGANDFGFEEVFARQLDALARPGDVLIVQSTSGKSANCVTAVERARSLGVVTIALLGGDGGTLATVADHVFVVHDDRVNHVQEIHLAVQHQIAAILTTEHSA
ncbi:MAG TPA: SIS domain-containing protein [Gemmatimonadales bacterium]|jgi:D-sedoheptulose 7-phosphate isomerase|nr:SIS domain-containing protein [Gemmatimonadales bacterium]